MLISRIGPDGEVRERDLNITEEQITSWKAGEGETKEIFSNLSAADLLFFEVGLTPDEVNRLTTEQYTRRSKYLPEEELVEK